MGTLIRIPISGDLERIAISKPPSLRSLQEYVEGNIELVNVFFRGEHEQMIVNEEGFMCALPLNVRATSLYHCHSLAVRGEIPYSYIVGNAILLQGIRLE